MFLSRFLPALLMLTNKLFPVKVIDPFVVTFNYDSLSTTSSDVCLQRVDRSQITVIGVPRTNVCEHFQVILDGNQPLTFEHKEDLLTYLGYLTDGIKYLHNAQVHTNFARRAPDYTALNRGDSIEEFMKAVRVLISVSKLNLQKDRATDIALEK